MRNIRVMKLCVLLFAVALLFGACEFKFEIPGPKFVPVESVNGVPSGGVKDFPMRLDRGVSPEDATNQIIVWTVKEGGGTGAVINRGVLTAAGDGKVTVTARVENGKTVNTDYVEDFEITIVDEHVKVASIIDVAAECPDGGSVTLSGVVRPVNATNKTVIWELADAGATGAAISIVNGEYVLAVKSPGTALVTAVVYGGGARPDLDYAQEFEIIVRAIGMAGISLSESEINLVISGSVNLQYAITPESASNKNVTWSSDNTAVAEVDQNGRVTGVSLGTALITVTTEDGGHQDQCTVTVRKAPSGIEITKQPDKKNYWFFEQLDTTGLELKLFYDDGTDEEISISAEQTEGFDSTTAGPKTVTVRYGEFTDTFTVTVTARVFTVTFDSNGGSTEADPQTKTVTQPAETIDSLPTPPTKRGIDFISWNTKADGSGDEFDANFTVDADTTEDGELTVYAQWGDFTLPLEYTDLIALYLSRQPGINNNRNNPVDLPLKIDLGDMTEASGWKDIFDELYEAGKYVRLDLSGCTMGGTEFDPGYYDLFDGMEYVAEITLPSTARSIADDSAFNYFENLTKVTLPEGFTSIGDNAFCGCTYLIGITLPETLTSIGRCAFQDCEYLQNITLPDGLTEIGDSTFKGCVRLTEINVPEGITEIGEYAFYGCERLALVTLPSTLTSIGEYAFAYSYITSLTLPEGITEIINNTFERCENLGQVTLPSTLTSIGQSAFENCISLTLTNAALPDGITEIGTRAFYGCASLLAVILPDGLPSIGEFAFANCGLISVTLPAGLTEIGNGTFSGCSSLIGITLPETLTSIGEYAFSSCGLTSLTLPAELTEIGQWAFSGCVSLPDLTLSGMTSIGMNAFSNCGLISITCLEGVTEITRYSFQNNYSLTELILPSTLETIGDTAFAWCINLTELTLPESLTSIGYNAFYMNTGLTTVICLATTPPTLSIWGEFYIMDAQNLGMPNPNITFYVPAGSVDAYKEAVGWSEYADQIEAMP